MIIWLILLGICVLLLSSILLEDYLPEGLIVFSFGGGFLGSVIILMTAFIGTLFTPYNHIQDLESVQYHSERIEIHTERLQRLKGVLTTFDYPDPTLLNADSPVASIVDQIAETEISIASAKEDLRNTQKDIRTRKRWIFAWTTKLVE